MKGAALIREVFDLPPPLCYLPEGAKAAPDCPELSKKARQGLEDYLGRYHFEDSCYCCNLKIKC